MKPTLLIIDDEPLLLKSLGKAMTKEGYDVLMAPNAKEGFLTYEREVPDMVLLDLGLPDMSGLSLLKEMKKVKNDSIFIMMTGQGGVKEAVEAIKLGAMDYLCKPLELEELKAVMGRFSEVWKLKVEVRALHNYNKDKFSFSRIIRKSPKMEAVCRATQDISQSSSSTILILGESGTGKGMLASAIHYNSARKDGPFVQINCATLVETLLESELFGHEKGAFTGAIKRKPGKFELADKGTIFLDEIGEISPALQAKLLKVIEEKEFERIGGTQSIKVDIRLVAATNRDLEAGVKEGTFREDLYYRLNVFPINMPPLRERKDDIHFLSMHFLEQYNNEFAKKIKGFSVETLAFMENHEWSGNVRELKNFVERSVLLAKGEMIDVDMSDVKLTKNSESASPSDIIEVEDSPIIPLSDFIYRYISRSLEKTGGNKSEAAKQLGITRQRLKRILNKSQEE